MAQTLARSEALQHWITVANHLLNHPRLILVKNVVFFLVLYHYWGRFYAKVLVGGPVRALYDLKDAMKKVTKGKIFTVTHVKIRQRFVNCDVYPRCKRKSMRN